MFGGLLASYDVTKEVWAFNVTSSQWSLLTSSTPAPALAGHTATWVPPATVYVIGGVTSEDTFSTHVYAYDVTAATWTQLDTSGYAMVLVYGHTAAFTGSSRNSIVVSGGVDQFTHTSHTYELDLDSRAWRLLHRNVSITTKEVRLN